jgi:divalent metal cation (Fe/Co/Zn/Cd) transporter
VRHILHPAELRNPLVNYVVLGLAMLFEGGAWLFAFKEFNRVRGRRSYFEAVRRGKDPTLFVVLFEDSAAMLGLMLALVGIALTQLTGNALYDGLASVAIGVVLGGTAIWLAYETKSLLIGERASPDVVDGIRELAGRLSIVERVNEVLTLHMGPEFVLATLSLEFDDAVTLERLEEEIDSLDRLIRDTYPDVKKVFVEAESLIKGSAG